MSTAPAAVTVRRESVVLPTYNHVAHLPRAVESVLARAMRRLRRGEVHHA